MIAGHVSPSMAEHYAHIRMEIKRTARDAIVEGGPNQNVNQVPAEAFSASAKR